MIPGKSALLSTEFTLEETPTPTYRMDRERGRIYGFCDGLEAVRQAVYKMLNTERYEYPIYSWNYGIETVDLFGRPVDYVCAELQRRVDEALRQDSRVVEVANFTFDTTERGTVRVVFEVRTIYGSWQAQKEVAA